MRKAIWKKGTALALSATLVISMAGCGKSADAETAAGIGSPQEGANAIKQENGVLSSKEELEGEISENFSKEETVYIFADAAGNTNRTLVADWLKNPDREENLKDFTTLDGIVNVKGDEKYYQGDGELIWQAAGSDIYYQGETGESAPVGVTITYTLDGEEIAPSKLAGKSGHLVMRLNYYNHSARQVEIDGKEETIYTPFGMVTGMILPVGTFQAVKVTNGQVISDGDSNMVVGMAFPGLKESLGASGEDLDGIRIPDYVEIEAEVTDFELAMTVTLADSNLLEKLTDGLLPKEGEASEEGGLDEIAGSMDELEGACTDLVRGTKDLEEGAGTLRDKTGELADGAASLKKGVDTYTSGAAELSAGIASVQEGAGSLSGGAASLTEGIGKLQAGTDALVAGYEGDAGAVAGAKSLAAGLAQLSDTISSLPLPEEYAGLVQSVAQLSAGAAGLSTGVEQLYGGTLAVQEGLAGLSSGAAELSAGIAKLEEGTKTLSAGAGRLTGSAADLRSGASALAEGSSLLAQGAAELAEGSTALREGMVTFDEEGIRKLTDVLNTDLAGLKKRVEAVLDAAKDYRTFAGGPAGVDSSVSFLIRTAPISK